MAMSAPFPDGCVRDGPDTVVTLVPGTWAGKAAWIRADSPLSSALTTALHHGRGRSTSVPNFPLSPRAQLPSSPGAGARLAEQLQGQISENAGARQWVVAHSHGGNIALHAVKYLRDSCADAPRVSTVTLATPFIHARRRALAGWSVFVLVAFSAVVIGWAWTLLAHGPHWRDWPVFAVAAPVATARAGVHRAGCMHPGFRWRGCLRWLGRRVMANPEGWTFDVLGAVLRANSSDPGYQP